MMYKPVNYYAPDGDRITRGVGGQRPGYNNNNKDLYNPEDPDYDSSGADHDTIYNSVTTNNSHNNTATYYNYTDNSSTNYVSTNNTTTFNSIMQTYDNRTYVYNPVENNYYEFNTTEIMYNNTYNTYYLSTSNYNYYITNNYTYNSYYIINNETGESDYVECYYEMPDGRDSFNLRMEDVWGEYFVYNVKNYTSVAEDDGKTLALYHLDGSTTDSSFHQSSPLPLGNGMYSDGMFDKGIVIDKDYSIPFPENIDPNNFTVELFLRHECNLYRFSVALSGSSAFSSSTMNPGLYHIVINVNNGSCSGYVNGKFFEGYQIPSNSTSSYAFRIDSDSLDINHTASISDVMTEFYGTLVLDEVRFSSGSVYSGDYISVPSQPFDTNQVLVAPSGQENDIGVKAEYPVSNYRIGGVRPTYPSNGYVYIALDDDSVVESVQQYQADGWYEVPAAIYQDGKWVDILGFNLSTAKFEEPDISDDNDGSGGDSDNGDSDNDNSGGGSVSGNGSGSDGGGLTGGIEAIIEAITGFFDMILTLIGKVVSVVVDFFTSFLSMFDSFTAFGEGFGNFLTSAFGFLPEEVITALVVGINICVVLAIFKFMRD